MDEITLKEYSMLIGMVQFVLSYGEWSEEREVEFSQLKRKLQNKLKECI